jgi:Na+/phosphate symporter
MGLSVVVPLVWTTSIVSAFCRVVLGLSPAAARRRVALHLVLVVCVGGAVVVWAAGGPAALLSYGLRRLSGTWM